MKHASRELGPARPGSSDQWNVPSCFPLAPSGASVWLMPSRLLTRFAIVALLSAMTLPGAEPCGNMAYEDRNQIDYGPLPVSKLRGKAVDLSGSPIPGVCVGLFKESDHSLVESAATSANGEFALKNAPRGVYRLVARYPAFGTANARIRVGLGAKGVVLRMRPSGIDTTSYIEPK